MCEYRLCGASYKDTSHATVFQTLFSLRRQFWQGGWGGGGEFHRIVLIIFPHIWWRCCIQHLKFRRSFEKYRVIRNDCRSFNNLPPRSPDATPCDFFLWGYVKDQVYVPPVPAKCPATGGTNQNRHWNHHRCHATDSLERTGLSCWCL